jgi:hypothetical protein
MRQIANNRTRYTRPTEGRLHAAITQILTLSYGQGISNQTGPVYRAHFFRGRLSLVEMLKPDGQLTMLRTPDYTPLVFCQTTVEFV